MNEGVRLMNNMFEIGINAEALRVCKPCKICLFKKPKDAYISGICSKCYNQRFGGLI
jgi:hypothetical protein